MIKSGIYQIVHTDTGRRYVGQAQDIKLRWRSHRYKLNAGESNSSHLQRAWLKYGASSFTFSVIEYCEPEILDEREQFHIAHKSEFNVMKLARSPRGVKRSDETRQRISDALSGKPKSAEHRLKLSRANTGKIQPLEVRAKKSAKQKGVAHSPEHRAKLTASNKARAGYKHTPETIAKIRAACANRAN